MVPGVHFLHVSMHFFHVLLSWHLPFFFSFLHCFVDILSLQSILWIDVAFSEIKIEETSFRYAIQDRLKILIQKKNQKYLDESWLWYRLLKVRFRLFLTNCLKFSESQIPQNNSRSDFQAKVYSELTMVISDQFVKSKI